MPRRLNVGGHDIRRGTTEQILLKVSEYYTATPVNVPVTVIRGDRPGPSLFLTAAIHESLRDGDVEVCGVNDGAVGHHVGCGQPLHKRRGRSRGLKRAAVEVECA